MPLSHFQEGEEEAKDETEDEADNADTDSEAQENEDEDELHVEEDVELQDQVSVEGLDEIGGRSTITDRQARVSSPSLSSDSWDSDDDPRDHPLSFTHIHKALPTKLCDICDC